MAGRLAGRLRRGGHRLPRRLQPAGRRAQPRPSRQALAQAAPARRLQPLLRRRRQPGALLAGAPRDGGRLTAPDQQLAVTYRKTVVLGKRLSELLVLRVGLTIKKK